MSKIRAHKVAACLILLAISVLAGCGDDVDTPITSPPPDKNIENLDTSFSGVVQESGEQALQDRATRGLDVRNQSSVTTFLEDRVRADRSNSDQIIFLERLAPGSGAHGFIYFRAFGDSLHLITNIRPSDVNPGSRLSRTVSLTSELRSDLEAIESELPPRALAGNAARHDAQLYLFGYGDSAQLRKTVVRGGLYPALGADALELSNGSMGQAENIQRVLALWEKLATSSPGIAETITTDGNTPAELTEGLKWICPCWQYEIQDGEVTFGPQTESENFCQCLKDHVKGCNLVARLIPPASGSDAINTDINVTKKQKGGGYYDDGPKEVHWDPNWKPTVKTSASNKQVDPHIVLAHELAHAWHDATESEGGSHMDEERKTTHAENDIREELGMPKRTDYSSSMIDTTKSDGSIPDEPVIEACRSSLRGLR